VHLQACTYRKVWEDDGNRQLVEVEQTSSVFFKTIHTRMNVVQASTLPRPVASHNTPSMLAHRLQALVRRQAAFSLGGCY
jgi:hypothetical protein